MKKILVNLFLFSALCISFSSLNGCGSPQASPPTVTANQPTNAAPSSKGSDYPPIPASVASGEIKNLDGTTFSVGDKKGKVVLLNLWATWCGPCRGEMPRLVAMQDKYRDKDFEILGINTDDEPVSVINSFRDQMKLNYTLVWSSSQLQSDLLKISKFPGIPQSFLIDREGRLRGVFTGGNPKTVAQMESTVDSVVTE